MLFYTVGYYKHRIFQCLCVSVSSEMGNNNRRVIRAPGLKLWNGEVDKATDCFETQCCISGERSFACVKNNKVPGGRSDVHRNIRPFLLATPFGPPNDMQFGCQPALGVAGERDNSLSTFGLSTRCPPPTMHPLTLTLSCWSVRGSWEDSMRLWRLLLSSILKGPCC